MIIQKGFTLIELIVVIGLFAILITLTVPAYNNFRQNQNAAAAAYEFLSYLRNYRQKALQVEDYMNGQINNNYSIANGKYYFYPRGRIQANRVEINVCTKYNGVWMFLVGTTPNTGSTFSINEDGTITSAGTLTATPGSVGYYAVDFTSGGNNATYRVRMYQDGNTDIVRIK